MNRNLQRDLAASEVSHADEYAQLVMPRRLRRKNASSSPRWLMWLLAFVAAVLMAIGIAAPQVTYALDAGRYDEYVAELTGLRSDLVDAEVQVQAAEILRAEQAAEIRAIAPRLRQLGEADPAVLPEADAQALAEAAKRLEALIPEDLGDATPPEQKRLEKAISDGRARAPISWLGASGAELITLAGLVPEDPRPVTSEDTVSLDALEDVRRGVKEDRKSLDSQQRRAASLQSDSDAMLAGAEEILAVVGATAGKLPAAAEGLLVELPNIEPEQLDEMLAAARDAADAARAESYVWFADGKALPAGKAPAPIPDTATEVRPTAAVRSKLALSWVERYLKLAGEALQEQRDYDEAVAAEDAAEPEEPTTQEPPTGEPPTQDPPVPPTQEPPAPPTQEPPAPPTDGPTEEGNTEDGPSL